MARKYGHFCPGSARASERDAGNHGGGPRADRDTSTSVPNGEGYRLALFARWERRSARARQPSGLADICNGGRRPPSARAQASARLDAQVAAMHAASKGSSAPHIVRRRCKDFSVFLSRTTISTKNKAILDGVRYAIGVDQRTFAGIRGWQRTARSRYRESAILALRGQGALGPTCESTVLVESYDRALPASDYERLAPRALLYESGAKTSYVYFPTTCIVRAVRDRGSRVGRDRRRRDEGILGVSLFMGGNTTPSRAIMRSAGHAYDSRPTCSRLSLSVYGPTIISCCGPAQR